MTVLGSRSGTLVAVVALVLLAGCGGGAALPGAGGRGGAPGRGGAGGAGGMGGGAAISGVGGATPICSQDFAANACALGAMRCDDGQVQACAMGGDGCLTWTLVELCGAPSVCERTPAPTCADVDWAEWPVPNSPVDADSPNRQSYTDNGDGTITDDVTKLMWQQRPDERTFTLAQAVLACWAATTGGHHDWRLPSQIELLSLVDYSVVAPGPAIDPLFVSPPLPRRFWSATSNGGSTEYVWGVDFDEGNPASASFMTMSYARCVR